MRWGPVPFWWSKPLKELRLACLQRSCGGRFSDAPHTMQDRATIRKIIGHKPILILSRQDGREEDGWRGTPFWWPVLYLPAKAAPSVFASTTRDAATDDSDSDD